MTVTHTDPAELAYDTLAAMAIEVSAPAHLATLAQQLAFYRDEAARRVREVASDDAAYLAAALRSASAEVGYIYARAAGERIAEVAMIDLNETDYFGAPLSKVELARRKRKATDAAKRLARELLAEPLDPATYDVGQFGEGIAMATDDRAEGYSEVSQAVHDEVERIMAGWEAE